MLDCTVVWLQMIDRLDCLSLRDDAGFDIINLAMAPTVESTAVVLVGRQFKETFFFSTRG